jgi:hypothetical protein
LEKQSRMEELFKQINTKKEEAEEKDGSNES